MLIKELLKIKERKDIKSLEMIHQYEDDHLQCCDCKINDIEISFNYYDDLGFLYYYEDSNEAFNDLLEAIKCSVQIEEDMNS